MVERKRISADDALKLIEQGKKLTKARAIVRDFAMPDGVVFTIAFANSPAYREELMAARHEVEEELVKDLDADAEEWDDKQKRRQVFLEGVENKKVITDAAFTKVILRYVRNLYDPTVSTADDPAVKMRWLVKNGVPLPPESYEDVEEAIAATSPQLIALLINTSPQLSVFISTQMFKLESFYEKQKEEELGNLKKSQAITPEEASTAANAKEENLTNSDPPPSDGSKKKNKGTSSQNGKTGS